MKHSEVRIGNLVDFKGAVIEVSALHLNFFLNGTEQYSPVPLNEEWLKKLGFQEFHYPESTSRWFSDDVLEIEQKKDGRLILKSFEINAVHQFQNVYLDLLGDELAIPALSDAGSTYQ